MIIAVGALAAVVWMLLAIAMLIAGLARFGGRESRDGIRGVRVDRYLDRGCGADGDGLGRGERLA